MLNQNRIILMTKLASFEENEGKKNIAICRYFRGDFIGWQVIKSVMAATVAFFVVLATYILYNFENFMEDIYDIDLIQMGKNLIFVYICVVVVYAVISYIIFALRYQKAKKSLKIYYGNLKKLNSMLGKEESQE